MKTITLQPWQLTALRAGRLKSVWVPLEADKTCENAVSRGIDVLVLLQKWLPYAVGDVIELLSGATFGFPSRYECKCSCHKAYSLPVEHKIPCCYDPAGYARIIAVSIRRVESITEQEARDAGCTNTEWVTRLPEEFLGHYRTDHPTAGQWAVKVDLEEMP